MFISDNLELMLGTCFSIIIFVIVYYSVLSDNEKFMKNNFLNLFLIIVFIILFFILGNLFQQIFFIIKDLKEQKNETIVINKPNPLFNQK